MSAFVCHEIHIATCAHMVKQADLHDLADTSAADIAVELGKENLASVAYRYSDRGRAIYAEILAPIVEAMIAGSNAVALEPTEGVDMLGDMLGDMTPAQYLAACRWAKPVHCTTAEAWQYTACLIYQSCEHPEWTACTAREWLRRTSENLGRSMAKAVLGKRHVWEVPYPA